MSDTLNIFGTEYSNVAGIIAATPNDTDLTYIRPQGNLSITANTQSTDVSQYATVSVAVPSVETTFIVTVSWNSTTEKWEPDCTYAEVLAAYQAGKTIVVNTDCSPGDAVADGTYFPDYSCLGYSVREYVWSSGKEKTIEYFYSLTSSGLSQDTKKEYVYPSGTKSITANGTGIDVSTYQYANVAVPSSSPTLQTKSVTPTESAQVITADSGYDGLDEVDVGAISSTYVGSDIPRRYNSGLTVSGATITAEAGYYSSQQSKSVASGTEGTPTATKGTVSNHSISVTPSVTNSAGYISGGTKTGTSVSVSASELVSGTYSVTSSGTKDVTNYASASVPAGTATAPSSISGTSATVSTGTNTLTLTKTVSVTPNVSTAGYISSGTAGNSSVSLTASVTTKAAATITPGTTNQTIASGTYLTGTQTIAGDADLVASNIVSGVQIFGVTGNVVLQNYYTGSSAPSSSTGSNGDLYLQT